MNSFINRQRTFLQIFLQKMNIPCNNPVLSSYCNTMTHYTTYYLNEKKIVFFEFFPLMFNKLNHFSNVTFTFISQFWKKRKKLFIVQFQLIKSMPLSLDLNFWNVNIKFYSPSLIRSVKWPSYDLFHTSNCLKKLMCAIVFDSFKTNK